MLSQGSQSREAQRPNYHPARYINVKHTEGAKRSIGVFIIVWWCASGTEGPEPEPWACNVHTPVSLRHQPALWMLPWQGAEQASEPGGSADGRRPEPTHTCTFQKTQGKSIWPVAITCQLARQATMIYLPLSGRGHTEPG